MYLDKMKKKGGLFKVRVELKGAYPDNPETAAELVDPGTGEAYYFIFRELSGDEMTEFLQTDEKKRTGLLDKKLQACLLEHNLRSEDNSEVSNADAVAAVKEYASLYYYILEEWQSQVPLAKRMTKRSAE